MEVVMKTNPKRFLLAVIMTAIAMWMFVDSTRVALNYEDEKATQIAKEMKNNDRLLNE